MLAFMNTTSIGKPYYRDLLEREDCIPLFLGRRPEQGGLRLQEVGRIDLIIGALNQAALEHVPRDRVVSEL